jgi:diguanylate cyclase (GGDEF)-like protein
VEAARDALTQALTIRQAASFREEDVPCRFGGEEFVVILPGTVAHVAVNKAEEVRAKIEALVVRYLDANLPRVTISIGVAAFPNSGDNAQAILKAADEALYRAKDGAVTGSSCLNLASRTPRVRSPTCNGRSRPACRGATFARGPRTHGTDAA